MKERALPTTDSDSSVIFSRLIPLFEEDPNTWFADVEYTIDEKVIHEEVVYKCIREHTSRGGDAEDGPPNQPSATAWQPDEEVLIPTMQQLSDLTQRITPTDQIHDYRLEDHNQLVNVNGTLYRINLRHHSGHDRNVILEQLSDSNFLGFFNRNTEISNPEDQEWFFSPRYGDFEQYRNTLVFGWYPYDPFAETGPFYRSDLQSASVDIVFTGGEDEGKGIRLSFSPASQDDVVLGSNGNDWEVHFYQNASISVGYNLAAKRVLVQFSNSQHTLQDLIDAINTYNSGSISGILFQFVTLGEATGAESLDSNFPTPGDEFPFTGGTNGVTLHYQGIVNSEQEAIDTATAQGQVFADATNERFYAVVNYSPPEEAYLTPEIDLYHPPNLLTAQETPMFPGNTTITLTTNDSSFAFTNPALQNNIITFETPVNVRRILALDFTLDLQNRLSIPIHLSGEQLRGIGLTPEDSVSLWQWSHPTARPPTLVYWGERYTNSQREILHSPNMFTLGSLKDSHPLVIIFFLSASDDPTLIDSPDERLVGFDIIAFENGYNYRLTNGSITHQGSV